MFDFHQSVKTSSITSNTGTYSNRPSASSVVSGSLYLCTDSPLILISNGSSWSAYCCGMPVTLPIPGDFTTMNSASISSTNGLMTITFADADTQVCRGFYKTAPSTPWTVEMAFLVEAHYVLNGANGYEWGGMFGESPPGKLIGIGAVNDGVDPDRCYRREWNSPSSFGSAQEPPNLKFAGINRSPLHWIRLGDNGTNRTHAVSADGQNWTSVGTIGRTNFLTAAVVGVYGASLQTYGPRVTLCHWKEG